ncbi:MAG: ExeA family protein [Candidatus Binatia bacterium]
MSSGLSDLNQSTPRHGLAAPDFFYSNLRIQETLTTIRYGIEARKGLIVVTGAPGTGKSTLLRKAATSLAANITCVFQSDPRVSFPDILRLILRHLGSDQSDEEESAMVRSCRLQLRSRLDQGQIVALFLDNAHQFPDRTLRYITQNFLTGSAEDPDGTLIQVVLAGRAELRRKLSQATLTPLRRRRPIVCELQPLNSGEIAAFIEQGLKTSNRPAEIFDERAVKRITLYANGNPGAVKSICQRALQLAGDSTHATITTDLIESAASDLNLRQFGDSPDSEIFSPQSDPLEFERPKRPEKFDNNDHDIPHKFLAAADVSTAPIFPPDSKEVDSARAQRRKQRTAAWTRRLTLLVILVGAAMMIKTEAALDVVSNWRATLNQIAAPYLQAPAKNKVAEEIPPERAVKTEPLVPLPGPDRPAELHEGAPAPSAGTSDPPAASPSENSFAGRRAKAAPKIAAPVNQARRPSIKVNASQQSETLQSRITKAIENRAIMGIEVSVVQGTAYLDGHVASERQRRAAERAARSVAGVERVRNRIAITFG